MDELVEVVDLAADAGFEGVLAWIVRLVGIVLVLAGLGLWVLTDVGLVIPAALVVVGLVLVAAAGVAVALADLAG